MNTIKDTKDAFDAADFYDCTDAEQLHCQSQQEAIEELIDAESQPEETSRMTLSRLADGGGIHVRALVRIAVSDAAEQVEAFVYSLGDWWRDEYGDPNAVLASVPEAVELLRKGVDAWIAKQEVWVCREVGTRTYTADEALAIVGEDPDGA